jgi:mannonate dehydratase
MQSSIATQPPLLEQTWRWFGPDDPVALSHIRQAGATGVVTSLHHIPCGAVWTCDQINQRKAEIEAAGLRWSVVESVPVHEQIKFAAVDSASADRYLDNYCQSLRNLAACGIHTVCYNFMAVTDWIRTDVQWVRPDCSEVSRFDVLDAAAFDLHVLKRPQGAGEYPSNIISEATQRWSKMPAARRDSISRTILMGLPGTVEDLNIEAFRERLQVYASIGSEGLRAAHTAFLKRVIPMAQEHGMKLAIHPDDPPFPVFGLPRIAGDEAALRQIVESVNSPANGITFCTGSLGAMKTNDLPGILRRLGNHIHFLHLRNVRVEPDGSFSEDDHLAGSIDMPAVMSEIIELMSRRNTALPMRPDHGVRMLGDLNIEGYYPGYSAIGRLRGLAELRGLELGLRYARHCSMWNI